MIPDNQYAQRLAVLNQRVQELLQLAAELGLSQETAAKNLGAILLAEYLGHRVLNGQGADADAIFEQHEYYEYKTSSTGDNFQFHMPDDVTRLTAKFKGLTAVFFARISEGWRINDGDVFRVEAGEVYWDLMKVAHREKAKTYTWKMVRALAKARCVRRGGGFLR